MPHPAALGFSSAGCSGSCETSTGGAEMTAAADIVAVVKPAGRAATTAAGVAPRGGLGAAALAFGGRRVGANASAADQASWATLNDKKDHAMQVFNQRL